MSRQPRKAEGLGEVVQSSRITHGWSQTELANRAGVSRPTVARIERGDSVSMASLVKVAAALGLSVAVGQGD